jgi:hypothetical protein
MHQERRFYSTLSTLSVTKKWVSSSSLCTVRPPFRSSKYWISMLLFGIASLPGSLQLPCLVDDSRAKGERIALCNELCDNNYMFF